MSFVNREFSWDLNALQRFYERYVKAVIKSFITGVQDWTEGEKAQARENIGTNEEIARANAVTHSIGATLSSGGIQSQDGDTYTNTKRARTGRLRGINSIVVKDDYRIVVAAEYSGNDFVRSHLFQNNVVQAYSSATRNEVRYSFARIDDGEIADEELTDIVESYTDDTWKLPKYVDTVLAPDIQFTSNTVVLKRLILLDEVNGNKTLTFGSGDEGETFTIASANTSYRLILNLQTGVAELKSGNAANSIGEYDVILLSYSGKARTYNGGLLYPLYLHSVTDALSSEITATATAATAAIQAAKESVRGEVAELRESVCVTETHTIDGTGGNRNVNYKTGEYAVSSSSTNYANEIELTGEEVEVRYRSASFSGDYGYAFMDANDEYVLGYKALGNSDVWKVIPFDVIKDALSHGATKLRLSVLKGGSYQTFDVMKVVPGAVDGIDKRVKEIEPIVGFGKFDFVGSPRQFLCDVGIETLPRQTFFTGRDDLYAAFDALATAHPDWFKRETDLGMDASEQYEIRHYTLGFQHPKVTNDRAGVEPNQWSDTQFKRRRIIVNLGTHCNEPIAIYAGYMTIKDILESEEEWATFIKTNFVIDLIPCLCPWSYPNPQGSKVAVNANGVNINRTFYENVQEENCAIMRLIADLKPKGLVGVVDYHNTGTGDGYLIADPSYWAYDYYCVLAQRISALIHEKAKEVFTGSTLDNHFHVWTSVQAGTDLSGQLHDYVNSLGLLGATHEIATGASGDGYNPYPNEDGATLTWRRLHGVRIQEIIGIALIVAFGCYGRMKA